MVGAGNVSTHLCRALTAAGLKVAGICSRSVDSARRIQEELGIEALQGISQIPIDADLVIISTTDAAVATVASELPPIRGVVAHTSGSVPIGSLAPHARTAVLYPLQTFSKDCDVQIDKVPFFTEASDSESLQLIDAVAKLMSENVSHADSEIRRHLHLAGVLSCNFPVYLLEITRRVLAEVGLPLTTVQPLVEATMAKAFALGPLDAMTGPARRGDIKVIERQAAMLENEDERQLYELVSKAILKIYHPDNE